MHFVVLTAGQGNSPSTQHVHHQTSPSAPESRFVDLLILDARHMTPPCLEAAARTVGEIRGKLGLRHGVLLCSQPTVPLIVAAIRCGLRDIVSHYIGAAHLRQMLRAAVPSLSRREYRDAVSFLRTFSGLSPSDGNSIPLARRAEELSRRAEELAEQEKALAAEKNRLVRLEQDLRDRTRRLDRQIARLQTDSDVAQPAGSTFASSGGSASPLPDLAAQTRRLEQRSAELDLREKLLNEMQALLLATPQGAAMASTLELATPARPRPHTGLGAAA